MNATDFLLQIALSNACFSFMLAIAATIVGKVVKRPHLVHLLWLLVIVKLVTPPLVAIPVFTIPAPIDVLAVNSSEALTQTPETATIASSIAAAVSVLIDLGESWLPFLWLTGCGFVFAASLFRINRFNRLIEKESEAGTAELQSDAATIAWQLGLKKTPTVYTTSARLSPMVWWFGGRVRIVVPVQLFDRMNARDRQWILAHELAHVRRRDHLVRLLEWLACVLFWWNPVVWWAQRNLRAMEEICCDDLVLTCMNPNPKSYANSLLTAVEFLAGPAIRPPAMASEINSGGTLERRFKMIVTTRPHNKLSRWLQACVLLCAIAALPLGITYAQDYDAINKRLANAVREGELSLEQAEAMMKELHEIGNRGDALNNRSPQETIAITEREIREALKTEKISREEAKNKLEALREKSLREVEFRDELKRRPHEAFNFAKQEFNKAVEAGQIYREDADKKLKVLQERVNRVETLSEDLKRSSQENLAIVEREIKKAAELGQISREDADKKLKVLQERSKKVETPSDSLNISPRSSAYSVSGRGIRRSVSTRQTSGENAQTTRGEFIEQVNQGRSSSIQGKSIRNERKLRLREAYGAIEQAFREAVETGKMSSEDAQKKLGALRTSLFDEKPPQDNSSEAKQTPSSDQQ